jgi:5-methylthioadenosine/S-adenosylhomocysteine deaminase
MKILIQNCSILPMTGKDDFISQGYIVIEDGSIQAIGVMEETATPAFPIDLLTDYTIIEAKGKVALPGFVNAHTHTAMTLLRGYADDMPLMPWLHDRIFPAEARLKPEDVFWGTLLANVEMIRFGTTCFADMYFFMDEVAKAVELSGIRASLSRGLIGIAPNGAEALLEGVQFAKNWDGQANGRITTRLGPHAPYTCPIDYMKKVITHSDQIGVGLHMHLAETRGEVQELLQATGYNPIQWMDSLGAFQRPVLGAHCVHVSTGDIEILSSRSVGVAHNPESNMKLASGVAPIPQMLDLGVIVGLGTDGAASNNNLDLFQEMRSAALLHKVFSGDPTVLPAYQVLEMATLGGARCLGLENQIGCLKPGYKADIILIDFDKPHLCPKHDVAAHLVYSALASDVHTVLVDGKILMLDGQLVAVNEKEIMNQVEERAQALVAGL